MDLIARSIATLVWLVVGLILWIPLIVRSVLALTLIYFKAAIERRPAPDFSAINRDVFAFYGDGIRWIWSEWSGQDNDIKVERLRWGQFFGAVFTAVFFWGPLIGVLLFFDDDSTENQSISSDGIAYTYKHLSVSPVVPTGCRLFKGCTGSAESGKIEIIKISYINNPIFADEINLFTRICVNNLYEGGKHTQLDIYYTDILGESIKWDVAYPGKILDGECKNVVLSQNDNSDRKWKGINFQKGIFHVSIFNRNYEAMTEDII